MPEIAAVPARAVHIKPIAAAMARWDRIETKAMGFTPRTALQRSLIASTHAWTALVDGAPVAMWGCSPISLWEGHVWLLGTDEARRHARAFLTIGEASLIGLLGIYNRVSNVVAVGNVPARRMLRHWGACEAEVVTMFNGVGFLRFWVDRRHN